MSKETYAAWWDKAVGGFAPQTLAERAHELGRDHGGDTASWVIDGNTSEDFCRKVIEGYDDGDPEIMDMQPAALDGQWADAPTPLHIRQALGIENAPSDEVLDAYEEGFSEGYWHTVIQAAYGKLPEYEPCGVCGFYGHKPKDHD